MTSSRSKSQTGFTLVELLVTVTILVISLAIGITNYLRFLNKQELYRAGSSVEAMLKDARSKAQNGFLGNTDIGFCVKLAAIEVYSALNVNNNSLFTSQIRCSDGNILTYDSYLVDEDALLSQNFKISFLPIGGATVSINGLEVSSGSAVLSSNESEVTFNLDQGGTINVLYE